MAQRYGDCSWGINKEWICEVEPGTRDFVLKAFLVSAEEGFI